MALLYVSLPAGQSPRAHSEQWLHDVCFPGLITEPQTDVCPVCCLKSTLVPSVYHPDENWCPWRSHTHLCWSQVINISQWSPSMYLCALWRWSLTVILLPAAIWFVLRTSCLWWHLREMSYAAEGRQVLAAMEAEIHKVSHVSVQTLSNVWE